MITTSVKGAIPLQKNRGVFLPDQLKTNEEGNILVLFSDLEYHNKELTILYYFDEQAQNYIEVWRDRGSFSEMDILQVDKIDGKNYFISFNTIFRGTAVYQFNIDQKELILYQRFLREDGIYYNYIIQHLDQKTLKITNYLTNSTIELQNIQHYTMKTRYNRKRILYTIDFQNKYKQFHLTPEFKSLQQTSDHITHKFMITYYSSYDNKKVSEQRFLVKARESPNFVLHQNKIVWVPRQKILRKLSNEQLHWINYPQYFLCCKVFSQQENQIIDLTTAKVITNLSKDLNSVIKNGRMILEVQNDQVIIHEVKIL